MVRAGDTAYDADTNLLRCAYIQAYAPVTHNDYLACSVHDRPGDVATMMIKQITGGVPTFSLDLTKQPAENLAVIKAWLDFYRSHLRLLSGRRAPLNPRLDVWQMGSRRTCIVSALFAACEIPLPDCERIIILNATGRSELYLRTARRETVHATWRDYALRSVRKGPLGISDGMRIEIPSGGRVTLTRS